MAKDRDPKSDQGAATHLTQNKAGGGGAAGASSPKPGSDPDAARAVGGKGDFGVPASPERTADRDYVSRNTKMSDPGAAQPADWEQDGVRDHGAGAPASGPGSGSGGDVDTDFVGVGTGGSSVSASGSIHEPPGPDDTDGSSDAFASGPHAEGRNQTGVHRVGGDKRVHGTLLQSGPDAASGIDAPAGADAATNPAARGDDSFAGEVSSGEVQGDDDPIAPSQDNQG